MHSGITMIAQTEKKRLVLKVGRMLYTGCVNDEDSFQEV